MTSVSLVRLVCSGADCTSIELSCVKLELHLAAPHLQKRGQPGGALVSLPQPDERGCVLAAERSSLESRLRLSGLIRHRHRAPR